MVKSNIPSGKNINEKKWVGFLMPHQGSFQQELSHLFWRAKLPEEYHPIYLGAKSTDIVTARNSLVKASLDQKNLEWLLFVDSDQGIDPSVPRRLVQRAEEDNIKVLSALTFILKDNIPVPLLSSGNDEEPTFNWIAETGLVEVHSIGTGCLLVHREVMENIDKPWFEQEYDNDGIRTEAEDYTFSKKAKKEGYKIYVDSDVVVDHFKKVSLKSYVSTLTYALNCDSEEEFWAGF